jgi:hydrogenase maturation protease
MNYVRRLVVGIGSHHGDDCIGWMVVDRLKREGMKTFGGARFVKCQLPIDLLERLDEVDEVHVIDAMDGPWQDKAGKLFAIHHLRYAERGERLAVRERRSTSSHGMGVLPVLQLAEKLGLPTGKVTIWLAQGESFEPMSGPSAVGLQSVDLCADAIRTELRYARTLAG